MQLPKAVIDIRTNWAISDKLRDEGLTTPEGITRHDNLAYGPYGTENLLDIYHQTSAHAPQPTIVNIHGGAWVYGCKEIYQYYCMDLALRGFTVVNINYRLAPESVFPAPIEDVNQVLTFLKSEGAKYMVDTEKLILVGDSAGAQLASMYANIYSNPKYAAKFSVNVPEVGIVALGLNCGCYDTKRMAESNLEELFKIFLGGEERAKDAETLDKMDTFGYITKDFPPAYILTAENDFLREEALPLYNHITGLGGKAELTVYGTKEQVEVAHIFEVNIKLSEAKKANDEECEFFRKFI